MVGRDTHENYILTLSYLAGPDGPWHKSNKQFGDGQGEENRKPFNKYEVRKGMERRVK